MLIRLYLDEDAMARALVQGLEARGIDVTTVFDEGMSERDDEAQTPYYSGPVDARLENIHMTLVSNDLGKGGSRR